MTAGREPLSAVDAAWLRLDRPHNLMMIVGVWVFDEAVDFGRFRRTVSERFLRFDRFRCRPVDDVVGGYWEPDHEFDLDAHVRRVALPAPAGRRELEALVSDLSGQALDPRRPLWQMQVVDNYAGGAAIIMRIHHCYADGIALTRVFLAMTDLERNPAPLPEAEPGRRDTRGGRRSGAPPASVPLPGSALLREVLDEGAAWIGKAARLARHPEHASELAHQGFGLLREIAHVAALPDDQSSRLRGSLGKRKLAAWADPLPFDEVRTISKVLGCTINDVLMATAAGAIGSYLRSLGEDTDGLCIRATVPVNLRDPSDGTTLGNRFGLVFLDLPVGIRDPLQRLRSVRAAMNELKQSYQPVLLLGLMAALGILGEKAEELAVELLSRKASLVASNVPGPQRQLYLAGSRLSQLMFWVPQSGAIGVGISILTYNGQAQFGVIADRKRIPDPRALVERFGREFEHLVLAVLLGTFLKAAS